MAAAKKSGLTDTQLSRRQQLTARLAGARQNLMLLKSQLRAGEIERDYWSARLEELSDLLEAIVQERQETDQKQRLAALYEVSKALGSSLDLDTVLNEVMDAIILLTGAERGFLMLLDEDAKLQVKAARNVARETLTQDEFAFSRSVIRMVAETGEQVVTTNAAEDPRFASQSSVVAHNLRSIQCVPLRARGAVIGVIYVDNNIRVGVFDEADLEMLSTFASQASVVIENARLFTMTDEALADRVEELSIMQEIDRQLNETLDFGRVMGLTLEWAVKATEADNGGIGIIDPEDGSITVIASHGNTPDLATALNASGGAPPPGSHELVVPIQREGRPIGLIMLNRQDEPPFAEDAYGFVLRLADHAAISIENARLYEAIHRANTAKTEFISTVTHELRLPMTAIKGYTDMILMSSDITEQHRKFLGIVRNNVDRMSLLVSDLSDISRIESGRLALEIEDDVDTRKVIESVVAGMKNEIERRKHTIVIDVPESVSAVRVDPKRLEQIFTNLVSNAYKYTPDAGTITIRARQEDGRVLCEVEDNGIGMTPEELARLYTKFWRADNMHVREQPGTGIGLAIAKNLVEMQGGEMFVRSQKDVGTVFAFTLEASQA